MEYIVTYTPAEVEEVKEAALAWKLLNSKKRLSFKTGIQNCLNEGNNWVVINTHMQTVARDYRSELSINQVFKVITLLFF